MSNVLKKALPLLSLAALLGAGNASAAEYAALLEVSPGGVLMSGDLDGFTATGPNGEYDEISNTAAFVPSLGGGFEVDTDYWRIHMMVGFGEVVHDIYDATILKYDAAVYYTGGRHSGFAIGPHVTNYTFFSPDYKGDADLELSGTSGVAPGLAFTVGDRFIIKGSVDYLMGATIDVKPKSGNTASNDLKLDGVLVQVGVMLRFDSSF